jgi:uncharacterized protein YndB with AHSA1/START domain
VERNEVNRKQGAPEVRREIYIEASPETVFALLTDATGMKKWQAEIVDADPVPGGIFRLAEPGGMQIEGHYVEVERYSKVVFTWGGIAGVAPGQSTVEFLLEPSGTGTLVRLRHYNLPASSVDGHDREWALGLPKLKAVAEGRDPGGHCLKSQGR